MRAACLGSTELLWTTHRRFVLILVLDLALTRAGFPHEDQYGRTTGRAYGKAHAGPGVAHDVTGVLILLSVLALSIAFGLVHRARSGRVREVSPAQSLHPVLRELDQSPGERATLLQFSSAFCAPCRATRRILSEVTDLVPGVAHVEVDAEQHLELVRRLDIRKTPTTLVLDAAGREVKRASGQPRKADVLAALGHALP